MTDAVEAAIEVSDWVAAPGCLPFRPRGGLGYTVEVSDTARPKRRRLRYSLPTLAACMVLVAAGTGAAWPASAAGEAVWGLPVVAAVLLFGTPLGVVASFLAMAALGSVLDRLLWRRKRPLAVHERLTVAARQVLHLASVAASLDGVGSFGADYVLLALARYGKVNPGAKCIATAVLDDLKAPLDRYAESFPPHDPKSPGLGSQPTPAFLDMAWAEARNLGHHFVGTEHLLLAIGQSDSIAADFLRREGVGYEDFRGYFAPHTS
jgi:hypothetical protein